MILRKIGTMKRTTEMYTQPLLESEKQRIDLMSSVSFDVDTPLKIDVYWNNVNVGELIMKCKRVDVVLGERKMDIEVSIRNITG